MALIQEAGGVVHCAFRHREALVPVQERVQVHAEVYRGLHCPYFWKVASAVQARHADVNVKKNAQPLLGKSSLSSNTRTTLLFKSFGSGVSAWKNVRILLRTTLVRIPKEPL
jgi:hypothetical protein